MTPAQCRAARAMLGWSQEELSMRIGKRSKMCVYRFEKDGYDSRVSEETIKTMKTIMEKSGMAFIGSTGVNLRKVTK